MAALDGAHLKEPHYLHSFFSSSWSRGFKDHVLESSHGWLAATVVRYCLNRPSELEQTVITKHRWMKSAIRIFIYTYILVSISYLQNLGVCQLTCTRQSCPCPWCCNPDCSPADDGRIPHRPDRCRHGGARVRHHVDPRGFLP